MYQIKQNYEDFQVEEIPDYNLSPGPYTYFWLEKKGLNTLEAIGLVAKALHVGIKKFGYAGNKDRRAITRQVCSVYGVKKEELDKIKFNKIKIKCIGQGHKPIFLGNLKGNKFKIIVRNLSKDKIKKFLSRITKKEIKIVNYFDEQRFSSDNVKIGKAIIKRDFQKAIKYMSKGRGDYNKKVKNYISQHQNDFVGALRQIPKKTLILFLHSLQSFYWNECVATYIQKHTSHYSSLPYSSGLFIFPNNTIKNMGVPLLSFDIEFKNREIKKIYIKILKKEKIGLRDCILKSIPEITPTSLYRPMFVKTKISYQIADDELNLRKNKAIFEFKLPPGSYATIVIKYLFLKL